MAKAIMTDDELQALEDRNATWREDIKKHTYPLAQVDIAAILGIDAPAYNKLLKGGRWLYPEQYEAIMDIDVSLYLVTCPEVKLRTEKRLRRIVEESEQASEALRKYF